MRWLLVVLCSLSVFSGLANADSVNGVRVWKAPDHTRVVFDLSHAAEHKVFQLSNPSRLVIDIPTVDNKAALSDLALAKTPIARIRSGKLSPTGTRFVFDLKENINPRSFPLKKHAGKPDRLVIDLYPENVTTAKTIETAVRTRARLAQSAFKKKKSYSILPNV